MRQEFDTVNVREESRRRRTVGRFLKWRSPDSIELAGAIEAG